MKMFKIIPLLVFFVFMFIDYIEGRPALATTQGLKLVPEKKQSVSETTSKIGISETGQASDESEEGDILDDRRIFTGQIRRPKNVKPVNNTKNAHKTNKMNKI